MAVLVLVSLMLSQLNLLVWESAMKYCLPRVKARLATSILKVRHICRQTELLNQQSSAYTKFEMRISQTPHTPACACMGSAVAAGPDNGSKDISFVATWQEREAAAQLLLID